MVSGIRQLKDDPDARQRGTGMALEAIWTDPFPPDNDVVINLLTGDVL